MEVDSVSESMGTRIAITQYLLSHAEHNLILVSHTVSTATELLNRLTDQNLKRQQRLEDLFMQFSSLKVHENQSR